METLGGSVSAVADCTVRKKRSSSSRRPRSISETSHGFYFMPPSTQPTSSLSNEEVRNFEDNVIGLEAHGSENKLKLKLKLGGVTRTIHTKSSAENSGGGGSIGTKLSQFSDAQSRQRPVFQGDERGNHSYPSFKGKGNGMRGIDDARTSSNPGKEQDKVHSISINRTTYNNSDQVRKSKRVPKRRRLDASYNGDGDSEDDEIRYLGKLNARSVSAIYGDEGKDSNMRKAGIVEDTDYMDEVEPIYDDEIGLKRKKIGKGFADSSIEVRESTPTTRNRALQSAKDDLSGSGSGLLEFPNGLPPAQPRRQKEKLSELELQLKKTEAAQRRRMQSEKAAREAEAEAIRKILGQDSARKKKEEKLRRQRDEYAQGRASSAILASNTVRLVIGPNGTIVTFSEDIGLPNIFNTVRCSYPPPREKCAAPSCTNAYKYRDSKSKHPLCSLNCYKVMQEKVQ